MLWTKHCATNKYDRNQTAKTPKITTELLHSTSQQNSEHAKNKLNYIELLHITTIAKDTNHVIEQ
jgi:hypothetical protein